MLILVSVVGTGVVVWDNYVRRRVALVTSARSYPARSFIASFPSSGPPGRRGGHRRHLHLQQQLRIETSQIHIQLLPVVSPSNVVSACVRKCIVSIFLTNHVKRSEHFT
ncbi:hypothetical protein AZE42_06404 [Rhizopogon vesiculosus]|uniref:Uncharacterized protein n=1 Tax=Rhizopogon vesiculosus TaxID=180088 RepID=A0A1J8QCC7_9AGAM|nr:hypothetical protein AZE42_06404 [Rhizopogon vesiculosus]